MSSSPTSVGIRELKAGLSECLSKVAQGEQFIVTDRGKPVARLVPLDENSSIERGIQEGWIDPPRNVRLAKATRFESSVPVLETLENDRK